MTNILARFFKEPPIKPEIQDKATVDKMYKHWSIRIFLSCYVAYIVAHFCRKNIAVALPFIGQDLGYTNTQLGILGSSLYMTYGIGKFINGIIADRSNVRTFLPTAMIISAIANLCFAYSAVFITPGHVSFFGLPSATILLWVLTFFWGANGWFQSMIFPPIAKALSYWLSKSERATKWSIWSTSHQLGVFTTVMISGILIGHFGWKTAFGIEAVLVTITGLFLYWSLRDRPQSLGLPDVDIYKNEPIEKEEENKKAKMSYFEMFRKYIVCNKILWLLSIAYAFVYVIRFGTEDWFVKYLMEYKGDSLAIATAKLSSLAVVGSIGAIAAGWFSDRSKSGSRIPINIAFFIGLGVCLFLFHINTIDVFDYVLAALIGAFTAGPQLLLGGVCALEATSKEVASAALGFAGMFGYVGAVLSASGTGFMIDTFQKHFNNGWLGAVIFWISSAIVGIMMCLVIMAYSASQKKKLQAQPVEASDEKETVKQ